MGKGPRRAQGGRDPELDKAVAAVRARGNVRIGFDLLRASHTPDQLTRLVPKLYKIAGFRRLIWPAAFPAKYSEMAASGAIKYTDLVQEVAWACSAIGIFARELTNILTLKADYDRLMLCGDLDGAVSKLNDCEQAFGCSVWLAEARINYLDAKLGFKEQREFSQTISESKAPVLVRYLATWLSFRSERNVSAVEYERMLERSMPLESGMAHLIRARLGQSPSVDSDRAAQMLYAADTLPLIDRYLALIDTLALLASSETLSEQEREVCGRALSRLHAAVGAPSLRKLVIAFGGPATAERSHIDTALYDAYTMGDYQTAAEIAQRRITGHSDIDALNLRIRAETHLRQIPRALDEGSIAETIRTDLSFIARFMPEALEAQQRLAKVALAHSSCSWASALGLILERIHRDERYLPASVRHRHLALKSDANHPFLAFSFPSDAATSYLDLAFSPQSAAVQLCKSVLTGDLRALDAGQVPPGRQQRYAAIIALRCGDFEGAVNALAIEIVGDPAGDADRRVSLTFALLKSGQLGRAAAEAVTLFLESRFFTALLPIRDLVVAIVDEQDELGWKATSRGALATANLFDIYSQYVGSDREPERADAFKDFLAAQKIKRASEVVSKVGDHPVGQIVYFLEKVCVPEVLDQSLYLMDTRAVEDERVAILLALTEILVPEAKAPLKAHLEELREIRLRQVVRETTHKLDQSKVYVNIEGIRRTLQVSLKENWQRYRLLSAQTDTDGQVQELQDKLKSLFGDQYSVVSLDLPVTERNRLFQRMVVGIRDLFANSKEFGLDANLSMNIRHGYVLRELRGPFVGQNLVTNRESEATSYKDNEHWLARLALSESEAAAVTKALSKFSAAVDGQIDDLNRNILRIKTETTPRGLFDFSVGDPVIQLLQQQSEELHSADDFLEFILEFLWARTEIDLATVRTTLSEQILDSLNAALTELRDDLETLGVGQELSALVAATHLVRPELQAAVNRVSNWFKLSGNHEYVDYDLRISYEAGMQTVKSYYRDTVVEANFDADREIIMKGVSLPIFSKIFVYLLDNAAEHAGLRGGELEIAVCVRLENDVLFLECQNNLGPDVDRAKLDAKLVQLRQEYGREKASDYATKEGGSGYHKIWRLLKYDLRKDHELEIGVTAEDRFRICFVIDAKGLSA